MVALPAHAAHAVPGTGGLAYVPADGGWSLITAGGDGGLAVRDPGAPGDARAVPTRADAAPLTCLAAAGDAFAVGDDHNYVRVRERGGRGRRAPARGGPARAARSNPRPEQPRAADPADAPPSLRQLYAYPSCDFLSVATRFTLPPRCLAFSPCGGTLAAAGDDAGVKLVSVADGRVLRTLPSPPYTRGLAFDPDGAYVAGLGADGTLTVWDAATGAAAATAKRAAPRVDPGSHRRAGLAWHPDGGALLAAPGEDGAVVLYERLSWAPESRPLTGGHPPGTAVCGLAFSPNGLYLLSAACDGSLAVWDAAARTVVAAATLPAAAAAVAWRPDGNEIAALDVDGGVAVWAAPVPAAAPGPAADPDALAAAEVDRDNAADDGQGEDEDEDEDEDGEGGERSRDTTPACGRRAALPHRPQPAVAPGATHPPPPARHRWLAYTLDGAISSRAPAAHGGAAVVEVALHDVAARRVPLLNDYYGFHLAALCARGALYASPPAGETGGVLAFRPFGAWAGGGEWSADLPPGEPATALAATPAFAAAITGKRTLRLFSPAGLQTAVASLAGNGVALAARARVLAVAYHAGAPSSPDDQCIAVVTLCGSTGAATGPATPLPLSRGAALAWLSFADDGRLAAFDTAGVLRLKGADAASPWTPAFDAATAGGPEGASYWPVGVSRAGFHCVLCTPARPHPGDRPVVTVEPLAAPALSLAGEGGAGAGLACAALRAGAPAAAARAAAADPGLAPGDAAAADDAAAAADAAADRALLKLLHAAVKAGALERALDAAARLAGAASLAGALKLANAAGLPALAERVSALLEAGMELDEAAGGGGAPLGPAPVPAPAYASPAPAATPAAAMTAPGSANPFLRGALAPRDGNAPTPASAEKRAAPDGEPPAAGAAANPFLRKVKAQRA